MTRYRTTPEEMEAIGRATGTLFERPITDGILSKKLPDHTQDHLPLSDCCCGTIEWKLSEPPMQIIRRCGGFREYANQVVMGPIL